MACRYTRVPEMFSALATKIMFWALARVIFSTAKIISWSNKKNFLVYPQNYFNRVPKTELFPLKI
jgi:hypothetical protein